MKTIDVKELLEAGAHFGHKTSNWHPAMKPYLHSKRGGIYIIDLIKTKEQLEAAREFLAEVAAGGQDVLFVGTKKQLKSVVRAQAEAAGAPYVTERWLGGMLTNFATMSERIKHLRELEVQLASGELEESFNKREVAEFQEEADKIDALFGGIKEMSKLPGALFVADVVSEGTAVSEARKLNIPVVGVCDSNANPELCDHVIPANDDAVKAVELIAGYVAEAVAEGTARRKAAAPPPKAANTPKGAAQATKPKAAAKKPPAKTAAAPKSKPETK